MITLNLERGLVDVESWEDVISLPNYTADLDPAKHELKEIIGWYYEADPVHCGLTTCNRPHNKGYVVTTKTGETTNIGNICGKTYFSVEFEQQSNAFGQLIKARNQRENIASFLFRLDQYENLVEDLRKGDKQADWVYRNIRAVTQRGQGVPSEIVTRINQMSRNHNGDIVVSRLATKEERDIQESISGHSMPKDLIVEDVVGHLKGIDCMYSENNLKTLVVGLKEGIDALKTIDIDAASNSDLKQWSKWVGDFDSNIEKVRRIIKAGRIFFTKENLGQLELVLDEGSQDFSQWLNTL